MAYRAGRFEEALNLLDDASDRVAGLLAVRALIRLGRAADAVRATEKLRTSSATVEVRTEAGILEAFALARIGDPVASASRIEETKTLLRLTDSRELESELWLVDATIKFVRGDLVGCEQSAWNATYCDLDLRCGDDASPYVGVATIANTKARALQVVGVVRSAQERYHEQYRYLREAIVTARRSPFDDVFLSSSLSANVGFYARDFGLLNDIVELEMMPVDAWPAELSEAKTEIRRSLAWLYALRGDDAGALRLLRATRDAAKSNANRLLLLADEAYLSRQADVPQILTLELQRASALAERIDWDTVEIERYALFCFARELSFVDPAKALELIGRYERIASRPSPLYPVDRRRSAEQAFSSAFVMLACGASRDLVANRFADAFEIWSQIGYRWRAATAALELATMSEEDRFVKYSIREAERFPASWLMRRAVRTRV